MKLNKVQARGFIGARDIHVEVDAPVLLVAGENESGKSSLYEAITLAATGEMARVALKKEYSEVVSDGATKGQVYAEFDAGSASFEVPSGKWAESKALLAPAVRYALNAYRFSALKETERKSFIFALMDCSISGEEVKRRLRTRDGVTESTITAILPVLKEKGFDGAASVAATKAAEIKGRWKEVTSETWGSQKAANWKPEPVAFDADNAALLQRRRESKDAERTEAQTEHGRLQGIAEAELRRINHIQQIRDGITNRPKLAVERQIAADDVERLRADVKTATDALNQIVVARADVQQARSKDTTAVVKTAPPSQLMLDMLYVLREFHSLAIETEGVAGYHGNGNVAEWTEFEIVDLAAECSLRFDKDYPDYATPAPGAAAAVDIETEPATPATAATAEARAKAARRVQDLDAQLLAAERALQKLDQQLSELTAKEQVLDELENADQVETPSAAEIAVAQSKIAAIESAIAALDQELAVLDKARRAMEAAHQREQRASTYHTEITAWLAISAALAPNGIPGEIVGEALEPFNKQLATIADQSGWPPVTLDAAMTIRYGGRRYELLAESGKWRADACIAAAIAAISGVRYIMLDRIDVNSVQNRARLLAWISKAVSTGYLEGALLLGTLKTRPTNLPPAMFQTVWLENGRSVVNSLAVAA